MPFWRAYLQCHFTSRSRSGIAKASVSFTGCQCARYAAARSAQYKTTAGNSADKRAHAVRDRSNWHRMPAHAAVQGSPMLRPGHLSTTGAEHLQDFVHGDGPLRSIGQQLPPIAVQAPLYSVPDEGLGLDHVRRAYSPPIELTKARGIYTSLPRTR